MSWSTVWCLMRRPSKYLSTTSPLWHSAQERELWSVTLHPYPPNLDVPPFGQILCSWLSAGMIGFTVLNANLCVSVQSGNEMKEVIYWATTFTDVPANNGVVGWTTIKAHAAMVRTAVHMLCNLKGFTAVKTHHMIVGAYGLIWICLVCLDTNSSWLYLEHRAFASTQAHTYIPRCCHMWSNPTNESIFPVLISVSDTRPHATVCAGSGKMPTQRIRFAFLVFLSLPVQSHHNIYKNLTHKVYMLFHLKCVRYT